jgi:hypothetical protein
MPPTDITLSHIILYTYLDFEWQNSVASFGPIPRQGILFRVV